MAPRLEVIGVHPVEGTARPCHLVEVIVRDSDGDFAIFDITQQRPGLKQVEWQIPHCARLLDAAGERVLADAAGTCDLIDLWLGDVRMAFFFHHLDPALPLRTPFGEVSLPAPTPLPARLRCMQYVEDV